MADASLIDAALMPSPDPLPAGELLCALRLPWPPSANHLYRPGGGGRRRLSLDVMAFRDRVRAIVWGRQPGNASVSTERLAVALRTHQPTAAGDIANAEKATLDALQGLVFVDDRQVDRLLIVRGEPLTGGAVDVWVRTMLITERTGRVEFAAAKPRSEPAGAKSRRGRVPAWHCRRCQLKNVTPTCVLCGESRASSQL